MYEILILGYIKSGVFLAPTFKYNLETNYSEKGTVMAKKLLQGFFTDYDLAYAGSLLGKNGTPGIDLTILNAIECKWKNLFAAWTFVQVCNNMIIIGNVSL